MNAGNRWAALALETVQMAEAAQKLANLGDRMRAQFQWTCNSDYLQELTHYFRKTEKVVHPHIRHARGARFERYWGMMHRRELRRNSAAARICGRMRIKSALQFP